MDSLALLGTTVTRCQQGLATPPVSVGREEIWPVENLIGPVPDVLLPAGEEGGRPGALQCVAVVVKDEGQALLIVSDAAHWPTARELQAKCIGASGSVRNSLVVAGGRQGAAGEDGYRGLVYFDAECPLCRASVLAIARRDRRLALRYLPLQSEGGLAAMAHAGVDLEGPGSLVYASGTSWLSEGDAVVAILCALGGPWRIAGEIGRLVPRAVRDWLYRWVARNRFRLLRMAKQPAGGGQGPEGA